MQAITSKVIVITIVATKFARKNFTISTLTWIPALIIY